MKILVFGDLHFDHWLRSNRHPLGPIHKLFDELDAVIILGDISNNPEFGWPNVFGWLKYLIDPSKLWIMPGNHDYYRFRLDGDARLREIAAEHGINFLQKDVLELGGVRFLACTLWSDFELRGEANKKKDMMRARMAINDYNMIRLTKTGRQIIPEDTVAVFNDHLEWLSDEVKKPFDGRTVVLSHHAPSRSVSGKVDDITAVFGSNLDSWILTHNPDLWLFGHTHRHLRSVVGNTRVQNVSLGYPSEVPDDIHEKILTAGLLDTDLPGLLVNG